MQKSIKVSFSLILIAFLFLSISYSFGDSWAPSCTDTYCLDTSHGFTLDHANTLTWSSTLDVTSYFQFLGHVNFTSATFGSATQTFGLGANGANLLLTNIGTTTIQATETFTGSNATAYVFYYYGSGGTVPLESNAISGIFISSVSSSNYYSSFTSWQAASSPAVYQNTTGHYLEFKQQTNGAVIQFVLSGTSSVVCTNYNTNTNAVSNGLSLAIILPVLVIAGTIIFLLYMIAVGKFDIALGDSATNGIILMGIVFMVIILITIIAFITINGGTTGIGC